MNRNQIMYENIIVVMRRRYEKKEDKKPKKQSLYVVPAPQKSILSKHSFSTFFDFRVCRSHFNFSFDTISNAFYTRFWDAHGLGAASPGTVAHIHFVTLLLRSTSENIAILSVDGVCLWLCALSVRCECNGDGVNDEAGHRRRVEISVFFVSFSFPFCQFFRILFLLHLPSTQMCVGYGGNANDIDYMTTTMNLLIVAVREKI